MYVLVLIAFVVNGSNNRLVATPISITELNTFTGAKAFEDCQDVMNHDVKEASPIPGATDWNNAGFVAKLVCLPKGK
jgi:hypothetical protein